MGHDILYQTLYSAGCIKTLNKSEIAVLREAPRRMIFLLKQIVWVLMV